MTFAFLSIVSNRELVSELVIHSADDPFDD